MASVGAQDQAAAPRLVETGHAFARGDGQVLRCLITADSARALTVGEAHDLVWWNLRERRPLRHIEAPAAPIHSLRLHPTEPWVVCTLTDGTGMRIDLETGACERWTKEQLAAVSQPRDGGWLSALPKDVSANGQYQIVPTENGYRRLPHPAGLYFAPNSNWIANDGTVIASAPTELHFQGLQGADRAKWAMHWGRPQCLVFTPDGSHLAISSLAATQVVDASGSELGRLDGPRIVQPGPGADEFWMLTGKSMQRWSAAVRDHVGEAVTWPGRRLALTEGPRLRPAIVCRGQPWTPEAARMPDGSFRALDPHRKPRVMVDEFSLDELGYENAIGFDDGHGLAPRLLLTSLAPNPKISVRSTLWRLDDNATLTHFHAFQTAATWVARSLDGAQVAVGLHGNTYWGPTTSYVRLFDTARLTPLAMVQLDEPPVAGVALGANHWLVSTGKKLLRLDGATLAVVDEVALPEGLRGVEQLARSADGTRIAIAHGCDVRLLRLE